MSKAYYNEYDPFAAAWLRNLIAAGHLAPGDVDERSITEVRPADLAGYTQCHFFAGIGGWSYALRLAGWPDNRPVWTGSCPCQPFSVAGRNQGTADPRHLWPDFHRLIAECRPDVVFGEQVEAAIKHGWLDLIQADLEGSGYAVGAVGVPAASVGAYHQRHRLWWVAEHHRAGWGSAAGEPNGGGGAATVRVGAAKLGRCSSLSELGDRPQRGQRVDGSTPRDAGHADQPSAVGELVDGVVARLEGHAGNGNGRDQPGWIDEDAARSVAQAGTACGVADNDGGRRKERRERHGDAPQPAQCSSRGDDDGGCRPVAGSFWDPADWIPCRDGKYRPVEPGTFPLAHGVPARVGRLRGYGNAIVPQAAAEIISAYMEITQ